MKRLIRRIIERLKPEDFSDLPPWQHAIRHQVASFTMTGAARIYAQIEATAYVVGVGVEGAIVECGVWRGGSMMAAALTLLHLGASDRDIYLFDTFSGMTEPGCDDVDIEGTAASTVFSRFAKARKGKGWCEASLEEVSANLASTGYPSERIKLIKGPVEETLPANAPPTISLLRLDTDWYASTWHELVHLYPRVAQRGIVLIDDYGHWRGARKAVDRYIHESGEKYFIHRIDYSGRLFVKQAP